MKKHDLLLLHGALGASAQFEPLLPHLSPYYTLHTFDFEGHGRTPSRNRSFRIEHFAENILEYLDEHALPQSHIFGYSMGGYAALYLALIRPGRVKHIATLGTINHRVRVCIGDRDTMVSIEETAEVYRTLVNGEMMIFPHTPHPFERAPQKALAESFLEFFK
ncbi:MAG TPA: alpha/beta fold hydrolase [Bacteroidota bacterium]|jgi:pimeloyl-ACP methyl ester carboxylesterase|nr:alpha/beta fold hydrolase [Bacteroidota bacterium]